MTTKRMRGEFVVTFIGEYGGYKVWSSVYKTKKFGEISYRVESQAKCYGPIRRINLKEQRFDSKKDAVNHARNLVSTFCIKYTTKGAEENGQKI